MKKKIQEDLEKYASSRSQEYQKPHLTTPLPAVVPDEKTKQEAELDKQKKQDEEVKKIKDDKCPQGFAFSVAPNGTEACRMPFSYHSGHGHLE